MDGRSVPLLFGEDMRAAKVDANQAEIVEALRAVGASVHTTHAVGDGFPDLSVGYRGMNFFIEVKDGAKPPSKRKLTDDQLKWHQEWRGAVYIANSVTEALQIIGAVEYKPEPPTAAESE